MGCFGLIGFLHCAQRSVPLAHPSIVAVSLAGVGLAWFRCRLLSWPLVFWIGVGHRAHFECSWWLDLHRVRRHYGWRLSQLRRIAVRLYRDPAQPSTQPPLVHKAKDRDIQVGSHGSMEDELDKSKPIQIDCNLSAEEQMWQRYRYDVWWWYNCTERIIRLSQQELDEATMALSDGIYSALSLCCTSMGGLGCGGAPGAAAAESPTEAQRIFGLVEQINPMLRPVTLQTHLLGIDSLQVTALASLIQAETGIQLSGLAIRDASTAKELLELVELEKTAAKSKQGEAEQKLIEKEDNSFQDAEYAIWWSPGQHRAMGGWVLRSDARVDHGALLTAVQWLIDRHSSLRAVRADPLCLMSFTYDAAVLASLYLPAVSTLIQQLAGWGFSQCWPRTAVRKRQHVYPHGWGNTPLEVVRLNGGQDVLEHALTQRRWTFESNPPFDIVLFELHLKLVGTWVRSGGGKVSISQAQQKESLDSRVSSSSEGLWYEDYEFKHCGKLLRPSDSEWLPPPWGFPALFAVRLSDGSVVWLRFEKGHTMRGVWKPDSHSSTNWERFTMWREDYQSIDADLLESEGRDAPIIISFLYTQCFHCFADGYCYYPLFGDLLDAYDHAIAIKDKKTTSGEQTSFTMPNRPAPAEAFVVLQRRLLDTFAGISAIPDRHSLRGSVWGFCGGGYSLSICLRDHALEVLKLSSSRYVIPLDYLFLVLLAIAQARAGCQERVEMTLYVPMRDGHEVSMVGLFADWRDVTIGISRASATVLGVAVEVADMLRHRRWSVFNALRKPERTVVNFQPLDARKRGQFCQLGEGLWEGGDNLGRSQTRGSDLNWSLNQPLRYDVVEEHPAAWWLAIGMEYERYPPCWARRFAQAIEDAVVDLAMRPMKLVHSPFPEGFY